MSSNNFGLCFTVNSVFPKDVSLIVPRTPGAAAEGKDDQAAHCITTAFLCRALLECPSMAAGHRLLTDHCRRQRVVTGYCFNMGSTALLADADSASMAQVSQVAMACGYAGCGRYRRWPWRVDTLNAAGTAGVHGVWIRSMRQVEVVPAVESLQTDIMEMACTPGGDVKGGPPLVTAHFNEYDRTAAPCHSSASSKGQKEGCGLEAMREYLGDTTDSKYPIFRGIRCRDAGLPDAEVCDAALPGVEACGAGSSGVEACVANAGYSNGTGTDAGDDHATEETPTGQGCFKKAVSEIDIEGAGTGAASTTMVGSSTAGKEKVPEGDMTDASATPKKKKVKEGDSEGNATLASSIFDLKNRRIYFWSGGLNPNLDEPAFSLPLAPSVASE
eukprot:gene7830-9298_t